MTIGDRIYLLFSIFIGLGLPLYITLYIPYKINKVEKEKIAKKSKLIKVYYRGLPILSCGKQMFPINSKYRYELDKDMDNSALRVSYFTIQTQYYCKSISEADKLVDKLNNSISAK